MGKIKKKEAIIANKISSIDIKKHKAIKIAKYSNEIEQLFQKVTKSSTVFDKSDNINKDIETQLLKPIKKKKADNEGTYGIIKSNIDTMIINPVAPLERIDKESGLPVYKAHLLKVGEGGGTPLCPFDCNCCF